MDRAELKDRARFLAADELQYALAREDQQFDTNACREKAAMRLAREMGEREIYELSRATVESVWRNVERRYVVIDDGQLRLEGAIRVGDNTLIAMRYAREEDWIAFDSLHEQKLVDHASKRARERAFIREQIIPRLQAFGGNPTTLQACADLFVDGAAAVAA